MDNRNQDTWSDLQAFKSRQNSLREKLQRRKQQREHIVLGLTNEPGNVHKENVTLPLATIGKHDSALGKEEEDDGEPKITNGLTNLEIESKLLQCLCDAALKLPVDSRHLLAGMRKAIEIIDKADHSAIVNLLEKFAHQGLIEIIKDSFTTDGETCIIVSSADHSKLIQFSQQPLSNGHVIVHKETHKSNASKQTADGDADTDRIKCDSGAGQLDDPNEVNVESLLSLESIRERENKKMGEELLELLSKPTAKERLLMERFRSVGGGQVQEFCTFGTKDECIKNSDDQSACERLHFQKIIQKHTDESLGDCSFLSTCFHMDTCKYVHYKVDYSTVRTKTQPTRKEVLTTQRFKSVLYPPQWLQCDLRFFDMTILGKFAVVMADPPWDIHMELPYGTLSDDEMRKLNIPSLQDEGLIFLWVTGRAMELGRECLKLWGYERCDEIIWVKTNQLQRIIRTGRTGHWLNHGKEHCLVGIKGKPKNINRGLDCDVIVAEVRATSHKPDEIYGIIERLSPGTKKIELFGRPHNVQPNWITLGNQLDGVRLIDPELIEAFKKRYKDGNCMSKN